MVFDQRGPSRPSHPLTAESGRTGCAHAAAGSSSFPRWDFCWESDRAGPEIVDQPEPVVFSAAFGRESATALVVPRAAADAAVFQSVLQSS